MHKILIVEDDSYLMDAYMLKLQQANYEILTAKDGERALELIKDKKIDLVILDILLPTISGLDVLKKIKSDPKTKHIPVIIASNFDQKETINEAKTLGASDYFIKTNISINDLISKLDHYIAKS